MKKFVGKFVVALVLVAALTANAEESTENKVVLDEIVVT